MAKLNDEIVKKFISAIPVNNHAERLNENNVKNWKEFNNEVCNSVLSATNIITRADILKETDCDKKIILTLIWGYPAGTMQFTGKKNMQNILSNFQALSDLLSGKQGAVFDFSEMKNLLDNELKKISGLGLITFTKLLYAFDIKIKLSNGKIVPSLIYDSRVIDALNEKQFDEVVNSNIEKWTDSSNCYFSYLEKMDEWSNLIGVRGEQLEYFFFTNSFKW